MILSKVNGVYRVPNETRGQLIKARVMNCTGSLLSVVHVGPTLADRNVFSFEGRVIEVPRVVDEGGAKEQE